MLPSPDDSLVFRDEKMFFSVVQTTPDLVEAEDMIRRAKSAVVREKAALLARGNSRDDQALGALLTRLNDELKYVCERQNGVQWRDAVKAVCGDALYKQVCDWLAVHQMVNEAPSRRAGN